MEPKNFDLEGFGNRIKERRASLGITQDGLAALVGVASTAVRRWENGVLPRDAAVLALISEALQVSVTWLLGDKRDNAYTDGWNAGVSEAMKQLRRLKVDRRPSIEQAQAVQECVDSVYDESSSGAPSPSRRRLLRPDETGEGAA